MVLCGFTSYYGKIDLGDVCILLNTPEIEFGTLPYLEVRYLRRGMLPELKQSGRYLERGTPVILVDGENSGEVFFTPENGYMGSTFRELLILNAFDVKFVMLFIGFFQKELRENKTGSAIPHLNKKLLAKLPLPLMPINRQRNTVCIVEKLFMILDNIAANLS
jgi:type I restriction enzyme S subunit